MEAAAHCRRRRFALAGSRQAALLAGAALLVSHLAAVAAYATTLTPLPGILGLPLPLPPSDAAAGQPRNFSPYAALVSPHPAVVRIVVPEGEMTSYGSGTLVDVRDQYGLVVTNWHVVRDSRGEVEVIFPDGFQSKARPLKVDADWDLAALIIWRPSAAPVTIARQAPQPGDRLTICGYGSGQYRQATGRCTQYYAPALDLPQQMVELDVEARQGDSGGPIFNDRGELAGVLFGAGQGTTLGSFGGRVGSFLASLAPDIGRGGAAAHATHDHAPPAQTLGVLPTRSSATGAPSATVAPVVAALHDDAGPPSSDRAVVSPSVAGSAPSAGDRPTSADPRVDGAAANAAQMLAAPSQPAAATPVVAADWFATAKNVLALIGAVAIVLQLVRVVR